MTTNETITLLVKKGTKVEVKEVDSLPGDDARISKDRHAVILASESLKLAVKKADPSGALSAKSALMTMCG